MLEIQEFRCYEAKCSTYRGWWLLLWLSGRGVLGLTPGDCRPFHFPLFCLITSKYQLLLCCSHHDGRDPGEGGRKGKGVGEERRRGKGVGGGERGGGGRDFRCYECCGMIPVVNCMSLRCCFGLEQLSEQQICSC